MPIESYLANVIAPLLSKPEKAQITTTNDDMGVLLSITLDKADMGSVIGKQGETAKAIRHLMRVAGVKQNARVSVKINEPDGSPYRPKRSDEVSDFELVA